MTNSHRIFEMRNYAVVFVLLVASMACEFASAQSIEKLDTAVVSKIKDEGVKRSQVMNMLGMLTDVYGPRLTNSPNFFKAAEYAKATLQAYGVENVTFDTWNEVFGRGWEVKKFYLRNVSGNYPLIAYPKGWSPGVKGIVEGEAIFLDVKKEEDIQKYRGKLKGKFVLFALPATVKFGFAPDASRLSDSVLLQLSNAPAGEAWRAARFQAATEPQRLAYLKWELCQKEGVVAVLEPSPRFKDNIVSVGAATVPYPAETPNSKREKPYSSNTPAILPQLVVGAEHYNRLLRQIEKGVAPRLELQLETTFTTAAPGLNVIGEISGTDLKDEIVMIGAHLDSWHPGTGTTDNAVGAAVMMEAMRIIKTLGISPRRTIRIALWGGEEQGLLGSHNYVAKNLGERLDRNYPYDSIKLTDAAKKFSVYFNMDLGSGKFRGIYLQGNEAARPIFRAWMRPFEKLGMSTITAKNITGTDHLSFDIIGLPGFQFIQDPLEYGTTSYHSNLDVFEKASESDLKHNAVVMATFAWMAANRDELMPRK
jgi:carboxypeptidase Q